MRFMIGRVKIKISFLFFAVLTLLFVVDNRGLAVISLICAALHEMGHVTAMICLGNAPDEIVFGIFGIRIHQNKYALSAFRQGLVVLCGPLVNIVLLVISLLINCVFKNTALSMISVVNLVIAVFNLLPIIPLDGGQIFLLILNRLFSEKAAQKIMKTVCIVLLFALIASGVLLVVKTGYNITLLATGAYLCVLCIKSIRIRY